MHTIYHVEPKKLTKPKFILKSTAPCPGCGGHKWYPIGPDTASYLTPSKFSVWYPVVDFHYHILACVYDECVNCGIVVC